MKCPENRASKAKGGESKRNKKKKKKKPGGNHGVEEADTMAETVDKTSWPMFTVVDSQGRCKELIVPKMESLWTWSWLLVPL